MMNHFFTLLLAAFCLTAVGQVPDYVPTEGLVAWYPMGSSLLNAFGDEHNGEFFSIDSVDGANTESLGASIFNGTDSYGYVEDGLLLEGDFSVSFWIRSDLGTFNYNPIVMIGDGLSCDNELSQLEIYVGNNGVTVSHNRTQSSSSYHYFQSVDHMEWVHVGFSQESGTMTMFVQGTPVEQADMSDLNASDMPLFVGYTQFINGETCVVNHFEGALDELGFWNRSLDDAEMMALSMLAPIVYGCTDIQACNYNESANEDDGTCASCAALATACGEGTVWDADSQTCIVANPSDSNFDGCVQLTDLLDLLSAYGTCGDCGGDCSLANATSTCVDGECVIESCNDGFADYNGEALDGCESEEVPSWSCGEDLVFEGHTYATVQINGQCWFAENLRSTSYANGDAIAGNLNDPAWSTTSSGGRATFGEGASVCYGPAPGGDACNEAFSLASYGRLYNWHAVNDSRGLCPSGWHVPSDGEWTTLTDGIGGALNAGNTLKAGSGWFNNGNGASPNGFDAFPGGQRMNAGNFQGAGTDAFFWTSTALSSVQVWFRSMGWNLPEVVRNPAEKNVGMSIRCLKNAE